MVWKVRERKKGREKERERLKEGLSKRENSMIDNCKREKEQDALSNRKVKDEGRGRGELKN